MVGADKLQAMKLKPAPNSNKANAVGKYCSILQSANNSWRNAESSFADSTSEGDSLHEVCLTVTNKHHHNKKWSSKSSRSSKKSSDSSISDSSSQEERKPKKKAAEAVVTCEYCKKYDCKMNHPSRIANNKCMWNKKVVCFQYGSVCRQMGLKYVKGDKFKKGNKDKWQKHKAVKDDKDN